jgi:enoyl-CoA hydratase
MDNVKIQIEPRKQLERDWEMIKDDILLEKDKDKKIARITFNRPEKLNAFTRSHELYLLSIVEELEWDEEVKVIIFRGAGRCFGTGHDVAELGHLVGHGEKGERRPPQRRRILVDREGWGRSGMMARILHCLKTTIGQVHGYCYGYHFQLVLACDMVVAAEDARFTHPGYRYIGPTGELALMIETLGLKKTKEMVLTGRAFNAQDALKYGLINYVVSQDNLEAETNKLAEAAAAMPFDGIAIGKSLLEGALDALGVGSNGATAYLGHSLQTNIRFEPDEFNLLKARKDKGIKGAITDREAHWKAEFDLR